MQQPIPFIDLYSHLALLGFKRRLNIQTSGGTKCLFLDSHHLILTRNNELTGMGDTESTSIPWRPNLNS